MDRKYERLSLILTVVLSAPVLVLYAIGFWGVAASGDIPWFGALIGFLCCGAFSVLFIGGVIVDSFVCWLQKRRRNKDFLARTGHKRRKKCVDCPYCRPKYMKVVQYYHKTYVNYTYKKLYPDGVFALPHPGYCKKLKMKLAPERRGLLCQAWLDELAEWED